MMKLSTSVSVSAGVVSAVTCPVLTSNSDPVRFDVVGGRPAVEEAWAELDADHVGRTRCGTGEHVRGRVLGQHEDLVQASAGLSSQHVDVKVESGCSVCGYGCHGVTNRMIDLRLDPD